MGTAPGGSAFGARLMSTCQAGAAERRRVVGTGCVRCRSSRADSGQSTQCVLVEGGVGKTAGGARSTRSGPAQRALSARCWWLPLPFVLYPSFAQFVLAAGRATRRAVSFAGAGFPSQQIRAYQLSASRRPMSRSPPECRRGLAPRMRQRQASLRATRGGSDVRTGWCNRAVRGDPDLTNSTLSPLKPDADARTEHAARFDT